MFNPNHSSNELTSVNQNNQSLTSESVVPGVSGATLAHTEASIGYQEDSSNLLAASSSVKSNVTMTDLSQNDQSSAQIELPTATPTPQVHEEANMEIEQHTIDITNIIDSYCDEQFTAIPLEEIKLLLQAKELVGLITSALNEKQEPIDQMKQINNLVIHQYSRMNSELRSISAADKQQFYTQVFKVLVDKYSQLKVASNTMVVHQVFKFFRGILLNFFVHDIASECLAEIVKTMFASDAPIYTLAQQSGYNKQLNQSDLSFLGFDDEDLLQDQRRVKQEMAWREQLAPGSVVDAIVNSLVGSCKMQQWLTAKVLDIHQNGELEITFDNMSYRYNKRLQRYSTDLAYPGTFTDDLRWKIGLQEGDLIDCMDAEHIWYRSTVLNIRYLPDDGGLYPPKQVKQAYVGYRIYSEEEGHKIDDENKKYLGWSNKYDIWLSVHDPQIQKHHSMVKHYKSVGKDFMIYDNLTNDDNQDIIINCKQRKNFAVVRPYSFAALKNIPDYLNEFGLKNGFEKILSFLLDQSQPKSSKHIFDIVEFLSKTQVLWSKQFACYFIPKLLEAVKSSLFPSGSNEQESASIKSPLVSAFNKEAVQNLTKSLLVILRRHYTTIDYTIEIASLNFDIGFTLLKAERLEQRIQGIKEVIEQIKGTKYSTRKTLKASQVMTKLQNNNILETVFGDNYHIQIVQRSSDIIKFYIQENVMNQDEIDIIWKATQREQQTKLEIYKIIQDCSMQLKQDKVLMFVKKFQQIAPQDFIEKEIECIYEISKYAMKESLPAQEAAQLLWDIAVRSRPYKKQLIELAMDKFVDLIRNFEREHKYNFINKSIEKLRMNESSIPAIKIIQNIMQQLPTYRVQNHMTLYDYSNQLINEQDIINLVIFDLTQYSEQVNDLWNKNILTDSNIENQDILDLPFTHRSQSYVRLNFVKNMLQNSQTLLEQTQLDQIWDLLMVRSKISIDSDIFFDWLRSLLQEQNKMSIALIHHFFEHKVCSKENRVSFKSMKKSGFYCIKNMFVMINEEADKLYNANPNALKAAANNNLGQKLDLKVNVPPNELIGIDIVWQMLSECDKKNNDLVNLIIDLITKVYHSISSNLEDQKQQIEDEFCRSTLIRMANSTNSQDIHDDDKKNFLKSCTKMLQSFFSDSERNGTGGIKPFYGIEKNIQIENLIIQNAISAHKNCPKYILLNVYSNMTVWDLKKIIAAKIRINPLKIQLIRSDAKKKAINDQDNGEILRKFIFEQYEIVNAQTKIVSFVPKVPLIGKNKELVPRAKAIFTSWFEKFSVDGWMTPESCIDFIRSSTTDHTVLKTDNRIVRLFNTYDEDCDGKINLDEFLRFYLDACRDKPDLVWSNLKTQKIGYDLKPIQPYDALEDPIEVKDPQLLPRYRLSQDQDLFNSLFELYPFLNAQASSDLRQFISSLRINPLTFSKMISLNGLGELLEETNLEKILYSLEIFSTLVQEQSNLKEETIKYYYYENQDQNIDFPALETEQTTTQNQQIQGEQQDDNSFMGDARMKSSAGPASGSADGDVIMESVKIHDSNLPIALPPSTAGPVMVNQGGNIPDAPPMHNGPSYGPNLPPTYNQNASGNSSGVLVSSNNLKNKEIIEQFRGHIITETYSSKIIPNEEAAFYLGITDMTQVEELYQTFVQSFISNNGFKFLLQLMHKLVDLGKQQPLDRLFETRAHKECLSHIIKIMKTFLVSSFMANSEGSEMNLELRKQFSSKAENNKNVTQSQSIVESEVFFDDLETQIFGVESQAPAQVPFVSQQAASQGANQSSSNEKKNKVLSDQEDFENEYKQLIQAMKGELGHMVLQTVDFSTLQNEIFEALFLLFKKKCLIYADFDNVQSLISLWISMVLYNHDLIQQIMNDYYHHQQASVEGYSSLLDMMIMNGLLSNENKAKAAMEDALKFIFINLKVRPEEVNEPPYLFLLKVLINNSKVTDNKPEHSKSYFGLLTSLFDTYFQTKKSDQRDSKFQQIFDSKIMLEEFVIKLQSYQPNENRKKFSAGDNNMIGYMKIIEVILKNEPQIMDIDESRTLAHFLIENCLFFNEIPSLQSHFVKGTSLEAHEKPHLNKCLAPLSREQAYNLLKTICQNCKELINELIITHFSSIISSISKPKRNNFAPRDETRSFHNFSGIRNLGSICYMNSMIQQFYHIPAFRYCLMAAEDNQNENIEQFENREVNDNMLHQLIKFMGFLELTERQDYDPRDFCFSFKDFAGQPTNVRVQQDTQEFLNLAFDRIERELASTSQKYLLNNIFQGSTCSLMICKNCGNLRQNSDNFYNLSLEVKNQKNIYDALKKFVAGEIINDFKCEACNQRVDIERRSVIEKLPNMLMVHLQRIVFDFDTFQNVKLNTRLEFPNVLNLKPYMMSEIMKQEKELLSKAKKAQKKSEKLKEQQALIQAAEAARKQRREDGKDEFDEENQDQNQTPSKQANAEVESSDEEDMEIDSGNTNQEIPDEEFEYKLVGVVVHMGTAQAGHYVSYINIQRGQKNEETPEWRETQNERWLEFNDSQVKNYMFRNIEEDCFGGQIQGFGVSDTKTDYDYTKNAYMLIYEKRRKQKIKIVVPEQIVKIAKSLGCDGTAISRAVEQINSFDNYFLQVVPSARDLLFEQNGIQYDEQAREHFILVDFNSAQQFVPHKIYRHVHDDNYLFLKERYLFNNDFFGFIKNLYETLVESQQSVFSSESPSSNVLFELLEKILFQLIPFTVENRYYKDLYKIFLKALSLNQKLMEKFISSRILVDKSKLEKDERTFIENMIQNIDFEKRETNKNTLLFIVNELFKQDEISKVDDIMQPILAMIPDEFSKNWLKIGQSLNLIFELVKTGAKQFNYFVRNGIITKLIDLFMEQDSPKNINKTRQPMGSSYASPQLDNLILTLSWIVRQFKSIKMLGEDSEQSRKADQFRAESVSYYYMASYSKEDIPLEPLSEEDLFMLSQKLFYSRNLKQGYERIEFGRMIAHLSFLNYDFSRKISKIILMGINKISNDDADPLLQALGLVLSLSDIYCYSRFAWILGVPSLKIDYRTEYRNGIEYNVTKLGVSLMDNPTDEVYEYKSALFKSQQTVRESLLQLIYSQRRRYSKLVIKALNYILAAADNLCLRYYLTVLEAPCYIYGRYIDWIIPYLNDQLSYVKGSTQQQQLDRVYIQTCIDKFNYLFANAQNFSRGINQFSDQQSSQINLDETNYSTNQSFQQDQPQSANQTKQAHTKKLKPFEYGSLDNGPEQFMIQEFVEKQIISEQVYENKVRLTVAEYAVRVTESKPDGRYNQVFSQNQFNRYAQNDNSNNFYRADERQDGVLNSGKKNRSRYFGRGQAIGGLQDSATYETQTETSKFKVLKPVKQRENYQNQEQFQDYQDSNQQYDDQQTGSNFQFDQANPNEDGQVQYEGDYGDSQNYQDNDHYNSNNVFQQNAQDIDEQQKSQDNSMDVEYNNDNQQDQVDIPQDHAYQRVSQDPQESVLRDLDVQEYDDQAMSSGFSSNVKVVATATKQGIVPAPHDGANAQIQDQQDNLPQDERQSNNQETADLEKGQVQGYEYDSFNQQVPVQVQQNQQQNQFMDQQQMEQAPQNNQADFWEINIPCVLVYTVTNLDLMNPVNVQLEIKDPSLNEGLNCLSSKLNFRFADSPISALLLGGRTRDILVLTKLRPFDNWGEYSTIFKIKEPKEKFVFNNQANDGNQAVVLPLNDIIASNNQQTGMEDVNTNFMDDDANGEISCPACTYFNSSFLTICEICGSKLK